jgi:hypothetical protein
MTERAWERLVQYRQDFVFVPEGRLISEFGVKL